MVPAALRFGDTQEVLYVALEKDNLRYVKRINI